MFPMATQLLYGEQAANRRFQLSLLAEQRADTERQLGELRELMDVELETQQGLIDILTTSNDALAEAITIANEGAEEALKWQTEHGATIEDLESGQLEEITRLADAMEALENGLLKQLSALWTWYESRDQSAGGLVKQAKQSGQVVEGFPFPTGTILWTANGAPDGWLVCDGTWRLMREYPELHARLQGAFGVGGESFALPARTDCPGYFAGMSSVFIAIIRT